MALINAVVSWLMKKRIHQIDLFIKYPHEVQGEWFKKLIDAGQHTEWGRKHGYSDITSLRQFQQQVPVNRYDGLKPYIDRMRQGEQNILWNSDIKWFAKSSGTTSDRSKFIPVSTESLEECHYKGGKDLLALYFHNHPDTKIFDGRGLGMGGSHQFQEINNEAYYVGDLSAILIENLPFWAEFHRVPRKAVALMDEWEAKIEKLAQDTLHHDVTNLSGVPSWMLLLLKRILEKTGKTNILEVWPNLEVFFHGGVNFTPYRQQFLDLIPGTQMNYMETYNASEGFFGIQDQSNSNELLLMLDYGIFYEFIPMDQIHEEHPKALSLGEVKRGVNYALLISTNGGLWRYLIGDTVEFTSLYPYRIKITGRTKNFINAFGEELIIDNAEKALAEACLKTQTRISEYTAAPIYLQNNESGAHEWLIEFERPPARMETFIDELDNALKKVNSDYAAKRHRNLILKLPVVKAVPRGTFYNWLKTKGKLGGQHKVPRLANHRKYIEEIGRTNLELNNFL